MKKVMKLFVTVLLASTCMLSNLSFAYAANWYDQPVNELKRIGAFKDSYNPKEKISVGDFADLLVRSATYEHGESSVDVLKSRGLIQAKDEFNISEPITRDYAIKIIMRLLGTNNDNYIEEAVLSGIISGYPNGDVKESGTLTYAEASVMVTNCRAKLQSADNTPAPLYSVEDFFKMSESFGYSVTKDGKSLIYAAPWKNRVNLFIKDIETGESTQLTKISDRDIATYFVKGNTVLYMRDFGGDENYHIFKTDEKGKEVDLTPYKGTRVMPLDLLADSEAEDEILIQMNKDNKEYFSVYRLNIQTGEAEKIIDNNVGYTGFLTDTNGNVLIAGYNDGVNSGYFYRESEEEEFELVAMYDFHESMSLLMIAKDNKTGFALSNIGRDKYALVKIDLATGKELSVLAKNEKVDISGITSGRKPGTLGAAYYYTDKENLIFFDNEIKGLYTDAQKALGTTELIGIGSVSKDFNIAVVTLSDDKSRGKTFLFNRSNGTMEPLADSNITNPEHMADMIPVSYKSRDGLIIHGYLTLPKNTAPENLPVIVNPHGGPWARDIWGYNPEAQFLANRGYAVLQINFRGSTGYGKAFLEAGYKQWGLNMQNDITDGVEWLKSIGVADPDRIGIYGGSYGGYATLAGVAFTPDLYAAAVDYVGVSNLFTFLETIPAYWESMRAMLYEMVGNPETDSEQFEATSPVFHADKIKTPLFIAQGANDPRVNKAESDQMVEALKANGIDVKYMVKDNEGHGFMNYENQIDFYTAMEAFFAEYLGGRQK